MAGKVVYVELVAQVKKFNAGMKKADAGLRRVRKAAGLVSAAVAAVGAVALRQLNSELNKTADRLDDIEKAAAKTQLSTNFLQDLEYALGRSGAKGGLNSIVKAFKQLGYALGQADAAELKSYQKYFELIGVDMKEFMALSKDEQGLVLFDALADAPDHVRDLVSQGLLGGRVVKDWAAYLNLTREQRIELLKTAKTLGRHDEALIKLGAKYKDNQESIEKIKDVLKGQVFKPFIEGAIRAQEMVIKWWEGLNDEQRANVAKGFIMGIKALIALVGVALVAALVAAAPFLLIMAKVALVITGIGVLASGIYVIFRDWTDIVNELTTSLTNLWSTIKKGATSFGGKVLEFVGLGGDDSLAQAAAAPAGAASGGNSTSTTTNNYYVTGNSTVEKSLREREAASRRGKGR